MLLTLWANQARVEQAWQRGIAQGEANRDRRWRECLGRREAAERAGLPFNEPLLEPPGDAQNGG